MINSDDEFNLNSWSYFVESKFKILKSWSSNTNFEIMMTGEPKSSVEHVTYYTHR